MKYSYSINGKKEEATCTLNGEIKFFLNKIKARHDKEKKIKAPKQRNSDKYINSLIAYINAVELHEIGHIFNWDVGCEHGKNYKSGNCTWCEETYTLISPINGGRNFILSEIL